MSPRISALSDISGRYDVILCDVWGVVHNGVSAFSEASEALMAARRRGVTVVLLTNSPRPNPGVLTQLRGLGVPDEAHDRIVTSGDVTRALIAAAPRRIFFIGADRDLPLVNGLDVELVGADAAETIVCSGFFDDETETPDDYRATLSGLAARKVPFICANPDLVVERGDRLIPAPARWPPFTASLAAKRPLRQAVPRHLPRRPFRSQSPARQPRSAPRHLHRRRHANRREGRAGFRPRPSLYLRRHPCR